MSKKKTDNMEIPLPPPNMREEKVEIPRPPTEEEHRRRLTVIKKMKRLIGSYQALADFQEPVLILLRNSKKAEFYEGVKGTKWDFTHSDGKPRFIILDPRQIHSFSYAGKEFRCYICHEDFPLPLPNDPLVTTEQTGILLEKMMADQAKWKAEQTEAIAKLVWQAALGVAIVVCAFALFNMLKKDSPQVVINAAGNMTTIISNTTQTIANTTII